MPGAANCTAGTSPAEGSNDCVLLSPSSCLLAHKRCGMNLGEEGVSPGHPDAKEPHLGRKSRERIPTGWALLKTKGKDSRPEFSARNSCLQVRNLAHRVCKSSEGKEVQGPAAPRQCISGRWERSSSQERMLVGAGSQGHASGKKPGTRNSWIHQCNHLAQEMTVWIQTVSQSWECLSACLIQLST